MAYEIILLFFGFHLKVGIEKYEMWIHNKLGKQWMDIIHLLYFSKILLPLNKSKKIV